MNEFEWRRQLREINQPVKPPHDLWQRIDAALDASTQTSAPTAPMRSRGWGIAACAAAVVLAAGIAWRVHAPTSSTQTVASTPTTHTNVTPWKPADPRLAGAAIELDAARMELQQAMQQAPTSPGLQRLLQRTDQQQSRLRELEKQSG